MSVLHSLVLMIYCKQSTIVTVEELKVRFLNEIETSIIKMSTIRGQ